jgi:DNA-binding MarR family transcriptional regulator
MLPPTRADLELNDTPALAVLARRADDFPGVDAASLRACQDLLRVAKRSLSAFGGEFARHGLSPGRYSVLMELYQAKAGLAPSEVAARIGVTRATVTGLIDGLVREGLATLDAAEGADRRRKAVRLSARGRRLLERLLPGLFARMVGLLAPLSERERRTLQRLLLKIERAPGFAAEAPHDE